MRHSRRWGLILVLLFTAAQSAVRLVVVPLWAHYDELTHFEYVRFVVEHGRLPRPGDDDQSLLNRIIVESGSQVRVCGLPLQSADDSSCLAPGFQFEEMPGYYGLLSVAQWILAPANIHDQVMLGRLVSVLMALGVAGLAFAFVRLIFPNDFLLAVAVPAAMATVFGYVDLMSAINNDVGAVAALSLLAYGIIKLIRQGRRFSTVLLIMAATIGCVVAKTTAWIGIPLAAIGLALAGWPRLSRWWKASVVVAGVSAFVLMFDWHMPADWQRQGHANYPGRKVERALLGKYVFRIERVETDNSMLWQALPVENVADVRGHEVTVGAWVRAPGGSRRVSLPVIGDGKERLAGRDVSATTEWTFGAYSIVLPTDFQHPVVYLPGAPGTLVEYEGVVLAVGTMPADPPPQFENAEATSGAWNGAAFTNQLRNASAEQGWPMLRPEINGLFPWGGVNHRLQSFYDWQRTLPLYWPPLRWQFVTFWTAYHNGFEGLPQIGIIPLALLSGLSATGLGRALMNNLKSHALDNSQWRALVFCGFAIGAALAVSILRIDPVDANGNIYYVPTARHFYVAIIPTMLLLMLGWLSWWPPKWRRVGAALPVLTCFWLGVWSLFAVQMPDFLP